MSLKPFACLLLVISAALADEVDEEDQPKDCRVGPVLYKHGQRFEMGCSGSCNCINGVLGCVSLCPPYQTQDRCRKVKRPGECCTLAHCPEELYRGDCFTDHENIHIPEDYSPEWSVFISSQQSGLGCMGTLVSSRNVYTSPECRLTNASLMLADFRVFDADDSPATEGNVTTKGALIRAKSSGWMELLRKAHDVNSPFAENCDNNMCVLFVPSFDPLANQTLMLKGIEAEASECGLTDVEIAGNKRCIELLHLDPNACVNVAGSGVVIKSGNIYFLRGYVTDQQPFSLDPKGKCSKAPSYIKYQDECAYLSKEASLIFEQY